MKHILTSLLVCWVAFQAVNSHASDLKKLSGYYVETEITQWRSPLIYKIEVDGSQIRLTNRALGYATGTGAEFTFDCSEKRCLDQGRDAYPNHEGFFDAEIDIHESGLLTYRLEDQIVELRKTTLPDWQPNF